MLVELKYVEVEIEPEEILSKAISEGDLSVRDVISICEEEADAQEILQEIDDEDIQQYCNEKNIEIEYDFEMIAKSLKYLEQKERASLLWLIIGINDEEIKHLVTVELVIPKLNDLINVKRNINPVWDYMDDYYFCVIDDTEINIRGYDDDGNKSYHLWMYKNKNDEELADAMFTSYSELQEAMMEIIKGDITFPSIESLLKITMRGKKDV